MAAYIVTNTNDAGAGSLRQAIIDAEQTEAADIITFAGSLSGQTIRLTSGELTITQNLTIDGDLNNDGTPDITVSGDANGDDLTLLDANGTRVTNAVNNNNNGDNSRVFNIAGGSSSDGIIFDGLTVTGGATTNSSDDGGGIIVASNGRLTIQNSSISGNYTRDNGGGIFNRGNTTIIDSIISGNYSDDRGGGIYNNFDSTSLLTIINSTISDNETDAATSNDIGGGISNSGIANITGSTFSGNTAFDGGGIRNSGTLNLTNVTVANNSASNEGGGVFNSDQATLTNTTVSGNDATTAGGGIYTDNGDTTTLVNSIVLGNQGSDTDGTGTLNTTASIIAGLKTEVFASIDGTTGGGTLTDNGGDVETIALKDDDTNPALDVSNTLPFGIINDATGQPRAVDRAGVDNGGLVDAGAFELQTGTVVPIAPSLVVTTTLDVVNLFDGETSLREAIQLANFNDDGSTVSFAADVGEAFEFGGIINLTLGELVLTSDLTIDGDIDNDGTPDIIVTGDANGDDTTTTDANGTIITDAVNNVNTADNSRVFNTTDANATIEGLTITGGSAYRGSGVYTGSNSQLTVRSSSVSGNTASDDGGGIYNAGITAVISSLISNNTTSNDGGGIRNATSGILTINTSTISNNATSGGTYDSGGGIYNRGDVSIFGSTISGNTGDEGGGIYNDGIMTLTNTTVSGNNALNLGDGIYTGNGETTTLIASIVLGNQGTETAGNGTVASTLSITAGAAADVFAAIDGATGGGLLANNGGNLETIALRDDDSNPALDVTNSLPVGVATDAAGQPRAVDRAGIDNGGFVDAGAFEVQNGAAQAIDIPSLVVTTTSDITDPFDGETTLREAIEFANSTTAASTITFASGVGDAFEFGGTITLTQGQLDLTGNITIDGDVDNDSAPDVTVSGDAAGDDTTTFDVFGTTITNGLVNINEADNSRVFNIDDVNANVTLEGLTITGGVTTGTDDGAGVFLGYGSGNLTVINSSVSGNSSGDNGGGIYNGGTTDIYGSLVSFNYISNNGGIFNADYAVLTLTDTLVGGNYGGNGAGIYNGEDALLDLSNSAVVGNTGSFGAGIYNDTNGEVTLTNSTISGNYGSVGGGLFNRGVSTLTGSTVSDNYGSDGGGIYNAFQRTIIVSNVTIANNTASGTGGGIYNNGSAHLTNTTVSGNDAVTAGDGIYTAGGAGKVTTLVNSIVLGNQGTETAGAGTLTNISSIIAGTPADVFDAIDGGTGGGLLADNGGPVETIALNKDAANPAFNTGDGTRLSEAVANLDFNRDGDKIDTLTLDANGQTRIKLGTVDLGAVEIGDNVLTGTPGVDVLLASNQADAIDGLGGNNDTVDFSLALVDLTVDLGVTIAQDTGGSGIDTIINIENIIGSSGNDNFIGSAGAGGNNTLTGAGGDDQLFGISGNDTLNGGDGNDTVNGGRGSDTIDGGNDNDALYGSFGDDVIDGGGGDDLLKGNDNRDTLNGGKGDDDLRGGNHKDTLNGGTGNDLLFGEAGDDTLNGNRGNDKLFGGDGNDILNGLRNNDVLKGQAGDDTLDGGGGNDFLFGGAGRDLLTGGLGADTFVFNVGSEEDIVLDFTNGTDLIDLRTRGFVDFNADVLATAVQNGTQVDVTFGGDTLTIRSFLLADFDAGDVLL